VAEDLVEVDRGIDTEDVVGAREVGVQRGAALKARVGLPMVLALEPAAEAHVIILDAPDRGWIEGDLELGPDGPEKSFNFSTSLGNAGARMDEGNAEGIQDAVRLVGDKSGAVVGKDAPRPAMGTEDVEDAPLELEGVLGERETGIQDAAGSVVEEGDEDCLAQLPRVVRHVEGMHIVDLNALEGILVTETLDLVSRRDMEASGPVKAACADESREGGLRYLA